MRFATTAFALAVAFMISHSPVAQAQGGKGAKANAAKDPCAEVKKTCETAGFIEGGGKDGKGLWADCINPIMSNMPQPKTSKKRLPHVNPKTVAACKAKNAGFGTPAAASAPANPMGGAPAGAPAAGPGAAPAPGGAAAPATGTGPAPHK